jgi:hypothetical protein
MTSHFPLVPDPYLEPVVSVERAGALLGMGRSSAYLAAARGDLPVWRCGRRLMVPSARLLKILGLDAAAPPSRPGVGASEVGDDSRPSNRAGE